MTVTLPAAEEVDIRPQHYQRLTEKIAGKPEERILSYLMLRSLKQARYAVEVAGPFRVGDEGIHALYFADPPLSGPDRSSRAQMGAGKSRRADARTGGGCAARKQSNGRELGPYRRSNLKKSPRKARKPNGAPNAAERELMEWKTAQFMESHLGEEYEALIISVQKFGFFVELVEIFVEGLVSIDRLEEVTRAAMRLSASATT